MKIQFAVVLTALLAGSIWAADPEPAKVGSLEDLDAQYGFRDLKFEQAFETCKDMTLLEEGGDTKFYMRKSDVMEQGGVKLKSIEYSFFKGKFASVTMNVAEGADPEPLFKSLEQQYGPARKSPTKPNKFYWYGKKVLMDFWSAGVGRGTVGLWSRPLQALQHMDRPAPTK